MGHFFCIKNAKTITRPTAVCVCVLWLSLSDAADKAAFLEEAGVPSHINKIIWAGYKALNLVHYFTVGEDEVNNIVFSFFFFLTQSPAALESCKSVGSYIFCEKFSPIFRSSLARWPTSAGENFVEFDSHKWILLKWIFTAFWWVKELKKVIFKGCFTFKKHFLVYVEFPVKLQK